MVSSASLVLFAAIAVLVRLSNGQVRYTQGEGFNITERCGTSGENCFTISKANLNDVSNVCSTTQSCKVGAYLHYGNIGNRKFYVVTIRADATFTGAYSKEGSFFAKLSIVPGTDVSLPYLEFRCSHDTQHTNVRVAQPTGQPKAVEDVELEMIEFSLVPTPTLSCAYYLYPSWTPATKKSNSFDPDTHKYSVQLDTGVLRGIRAVLSDTKVSVKQAEFIDIAPVVTTTTAATLPTGNPGPGPGPGPGPATITENPNADVTAEGGDVNAAKSGSNTGYIIGAVAIVLIAITAGAVAFFVLRKPAKPKIDPVLPAAASGDKDDKPAIETVRSKLESS